MTNRLLADVVPVGALGFAADDFLREIQAMADRFDVIRIDGQDFRQRGAEVDPACLVDNGVVPVTDTMRGRRWTSSMICSRI